MALLRILIVDDNDAVRAGIRALLASRTDYAVCGEAVDGLDAIAKAEQLHPDVVLMDISMPHMNGLEATRLLQRDVPDSQVLIVSQNDPVSGRRAAAMVNARGFVSKSELPTELFRQIDDIAATRTPGPQSAERGAAHATSSARDMDDAGEQRRTQAEQALRASEEKYRTLFDSIDEAFLLIDLLYDDAERAVDYRFVECNRGFERQTGLIDAMGKTALEVDPSLERWWIDTFHQVASSGVSKRFERYYAPADAWLSVYASRVGGEGSRRVAVVFGNVTERKRAERELRRVARLDAFRARLGDALRALTEPAEIEGVASRVLGEYLAVSRAMYVELESEKDREYFVVRRNYRVPEVSALVGRFRVDDFGRTLVDELRSGRTLMVADVAGDARLSESERQAYLALRIGAFIAVPLIHHGRLSALLSVQHTSPRHWTADETLLMQETAERAWSAGERARAERALRSSEAKLQLSLKASVMGTFLWYPQEDRAEVDPQVTAMFGLGSNEQLTLANVLGTLVYAEDRDRYRDGIAAALDPEGGGRLEEEIRVRWPDGSEHWLAITAQVDFAGEPRRAQRMAGVIGNVTARKVVEVALRESEERFRHLAERREAEVLMRTRELEARNRELLSQQERLRELSRRMTQVQDDERRHIARELHDSAGQTLTVLGLKLAELSQLAADSDSPLGDKIAAAGEMMQRLTRDIRTATYLLHPPLLDDSGINATLHWYVQGLAERSNLRIRLDIAEDFGRLPPDVELAMFRVVQESLTNILRHSGSESAEICVRRQDADNVSVTVRDHGKGISADKLAAIHSGIGGLGIRGMRDRIGQLRGELQVTSDDSGTLVAVTLPAAAQSLH
ncbi:MAG TPA: response regulator [Steroidobacteraceae bacterium]|nr:response regulator [Steroidobacteraceae bacterium]